MSLFPTARYQHVPSAPPLSARPGLAASAPAPFPDGLAVAAAAVRRLQPARAERTRAAVPGGAGRSQLVPRHAGRRDRSPLAGPVRQEDSACQFMVVAGGRPEGAGSALSAWRALEPDRPAVPHPAAA